MRHPLVIYAHVRASHGVRGGKCGGCGGEEGVEIDGMVAVGLKVQSKLGAILAHSVRCEADCRYDISYNFLDTNVAAHTNELQL